MSIMRTRTVTMLVACAILVAGPAKASVQLAAYPVSGNDTAICGFGTEIAGPLFAASDSAHGCELWTSDGTSQGTSLLQDIYPLLNG